MELLRNALANVTWTYHSEQGHPDPQNQCAEPSCQHASRILANPAAAEPRWPSGPEVERLRQLVITAEAVLVAEKERVTRLRELVDEQAEDAGLWFFARTAPEGYLQQELRRLHTAIETALANPAEEK